MTQPTLDPYAVLGIPRGASAQQVQRSYRQLAKRYHPDLHPDGQTSERMRRINQAWEILSSSTRRARYDADHPRHGSSAGHWSGSPRRSSPAATARGTWEAAWASTAEARTYPQAGGWGDGSPAARPQRAAGPWPDLSSEPSRRWPAAVVTVVVVLLLIGTIFLGFLPSPLFGIVLLVVASRIFGRFD